jgi:hypothetical protein
MTFAKSPVTMVANVNDFLSKSGANIIIGNQGEILWEGAGFHLTAGEVRNSERVRRGKIIAEGKI